MTTETPHLRQLRARRAAYLLHAGGGTSTGAARQAFRDRFERQVDPSGILDPAERARRADFARKAFYTELAIRSVESRRARAGRKARTRQSVHDTAAGIPIPAAVAEAGRAGAQLQSQQ